MFPRLLFTLLLLPTTATTATTPSPPPPVILLNGWAGARMQATLDKNSGPHSYCDRNSHGQSVDLWLSAKELVPGVIDCLFDNMALRYNSTNKTYSNTPGVTLDGSVDFGGVDGLNYLDKGVKLSGYFATLISRLEKTLNYTVGKDLRGAPYDWRLAPDGLGQSVVGAASSLPYFTRLKQLVEDTYTLNNNRAVVLLTHSMGGPVALSFLQLQTTEWKTTYVAGFMPLSPPFGGAVSTMLALVSGDTLGVPIVSHKIFHPIQSTCASGPWLFPQPSLWPSTDVLLTAGSTVYTSSNYTQLTSDLGLAQAHNMFVDGVNALALGAFEPPHVRVEVLRGTGVATMASLVYSDRFVSGTVPNAPVERYEYAGDGTVNDRSLNRGKEWMGKQKELVRYWKYENTSHFGILKSDEALDQIVSLLVTFE